MPRVGIALGSNLGDRLAHLQAARSALREIASPGAQFLQAAIYQTEPMACPADSPQFYNSVVEIDFPATPAELLELTQAIEKKLGRCHVVERNAPRVIDLDLLYFGELLVNCDDLEIPHPRLTERRFVLQPLAEIRPNLILPGQTVSSSELLSTLVATEPPLLRVAD